MKHWTILISLSLCIICHAQDNTTETESTGPKTAVGRAIKTISEVDAQFEANQAEVLEGINPPPPAPAEEASAESESAADQSTPESEDMMEAESEVTADLELPDSVDPEVIAVEEVYMDFGDEEATSSVSREDDTISVDFPDEDVRTIIRNVADLYELNVVIPDTLVGSVSLKLRDVTWRQVFDVVLEPLGYTWIEDRNIIKIKSQEELLIEPVATRVFIINFAAAGELQASVAPLIDGSAGGRIQVDTRSNALVITERPSRMNDIQAIIERLDRPTEQVMIESKFVEITSRDGKNLGVDWSSLSGYSLSAGPFGRSYENNGIRTKTDNNELTTTGEAGTSYTKQQGSDFSLTDGLTIIDTELDAINNSNTATLTTTNGVANTNTLTKIDSAVFSADAFQLVLSALQSNNEVEVISNPTVVTVNNTAAQINIGEEYPLPSYTYNDETGNFEVSGFEYKPIGIILNVTPQVNSAGFINLAIAPEISNRGESVNFNDANIPIITTRRTKSTVTIKSGFTLAIGGMVQRQTGDTQSKVPLLGDLPLMGRLFRHSSKSTDVRNLIIFITAKVLNPDGSTYRDVFSPIQLNEMGIHERDVPGYEPPASEAQMLKEIERQRAEMERLKSEAMLKAQLLKLQQEREEKNKPKRGILNQ